MTDIARLGLSVDASGYVRAKRDMDGFRKSASETTKQTDGMGKTMSSTNNIAAAFGRTLGLISASLVTTGIVRYADAWTNVENRLKLVTETTAQLESVTNGVVEVALRSHAALEETASLYSTLARYAGDLVDSDEELLRITETLNKSFAVSGAGAAEQAGAIRQLSQALASGALRGDEFNSINENAPRIMDAVAKSLNLTKGELREFAAEGGITAEIVINAVSGMADEIDADFASMNRTMGQFWQNASTNITQFIGSSESVQDVVQVFGRGIVLLSENLDEITGAIQALATVMGVRFVASLGAAAAGFIGSTRVAIAHNAALIENARLNNIAAQAEIVRTAALAKATAAQAVDTASIARATAAQAAYNAALVRGTAAQTAHTAAAAKYTAGAIAGAAATRALGGAMALLGGPAGLVLLAGTALVYFIQQAESAEEKTARLSSEVDNLVGSFADLSVAKIDLQISEQLRELESLSAELESLQAPIRTGALDIGDEGMAVYLVLQKQYREEVERINGSMEDAAVKAAALARARENLTSQIEAEKAATEALNDATGATVSEYDKVIAALRAELAVVGMTAKQKEIYQAIQKAGVKIGSAEAAIIEQLIDQRYDEAEAMDEQAEALENVNDQLDRMFAMESKRSTATAGILTNIDALSREYNALLAGTEAHKAVTRELAIEAAMRQAVAEGIINEGDPAYRQLIETQYDLNEAVQGFTAEADPMAQSWQAALERVDNAFVELWKSAFTGFKGFAQSLKDAFIQLLAELAHRAATQKILIALGLGDGGTGSIMGGLSKIPGFDNLMQNTGINDILKGFGKGEGGFDKTALLDGFKQMGLTIGASWAGSEIGTAIGEGLFNKQANSNIGQTIGTAIGASFGPLGALAGSALGSMLDVATGGDGYKRSNAGFLVGDTPGAKPEYTFNVENFTSGLEVTGFARREDQQVARQVIEGFRELDAFIVETTKSLGGFVDQLRISGLNEEATQGSAGTFLGLGRDADLPAQMKAFVDQLIDSMGGLDQSLVDLVKNASTAEEAIRVLGDASRLVEIQRLTSGMNAVEQAREQYNAQTSLLSVYQQSTDALRQLGMGYTGTVEQTEQLAAVMLQQQEATYNLALAYLQVQGSVDSLFGGLSENIRMSLMSEQELYEYQRAQIEAMADSIKLMTDPEQILGAANQIEQQLSAVWGRLDEEQRKVMGDDFLAFIDQTNQIAQDRLTAGLASVETTQEDINRTIQQGIQNAATQMQLASSTIMQAANTLLQGATMIQNGSRQQMGYETNA